jgi:hypothetical protein
LSFARPKRGGGKLTFQKWLSRWASGGKIVIKTTAAKMTALFDLGTVIFAKLVQQKNTTVKKECRERKIQVQLRRAKEHE